MLGRWPRAKAMVMDTTFIHTAYNDADEPADLLFVDFWHPDLTNDECLALTLFQLELDRYLLRRAQHLAGARSSLEASLRGGAG